MPDGRKRDELTERPAVRLLHLEDNPLDATLIHHRLESSGLAFEIVHARDEAAYVSALTSGSFDLILTDFSILGFDGLSALALAREHQPDTPVIVISGTIGEEDAVRCLHAGARDYLIKGRLERLVPAVERAIEEAAEFHRRRRAERELQESEKRHRLLFVSNPMPMWVFDTETLRFLEVNPAAIEAYGYSEAEFLAMTILDIRPEEDRELVRQSVVTDSDRMTREVWKHIRKNGELIDVEVMAESLVFGGRNARLVLANDITERRRAERALRESEALLRIAGRAAKLGGWSIEPRGNRVTLSDEARRIQDLPPDSTPSFEEALRYYAPEWRDTIREAIVRCAREGTPFDEELELITAKGRRIWVRGIGQAVRGSGGRVERVQGAIQDITDRKRAEATLREQASLLDEARDAIMVRDLDDRISYWNRGSERLYGWSHDEVIGRSVRPLLYREPEGYEAARESVLAAGEWDGELEQFSRDGQRLIVASRWTLVRDRTGAAKRILVINTDVTERRALEQQFFRAQRMDSIGTLAGGIAHDLNNVLSPILMAASLLETRVHDERAHRLLATIQSCTSRGRDLIGQILSFARGVDAERTDVSVDALFGEIARIVRSTFPKNVELSQQIAPNLRLVWGAPTQLHQVLLNLCVNARDAMPEGGRLSIRAENTSPEDVGSLGRDAVIITVEDTGTGIPDDILAKVFEPFFTTKTVGRGTGLGLSTTLAIVKGHGGHMSVESQPGSGTRFRIELPAAVELKRSEVHSDPATLPRGQQELVLIVDDEASIREIARQILEMYDYRVALAANGAEAIVLYDSHRDEVALAIVDSEMPVMDGPAAIRELVNRGMPAARIIAMSGSEGGNRSAAPTFLAKPFTGDTLLRVIGRLLHEAA